VEIDKVSPVVENITAWILRNASALLGLFVIKTLHHHERRDGTGYPDRQGEQDISELAQMAAIVVIKPHETSLLTPKVNVFYSTKSQTYIKPQMVDLARGVGYGGGDKIVRYEAPEKWQVDPLRFMQLA
jgi:hypothetical protein